MTKIFFLRPDLAPLNLLFFQCIFVASGCEALLIIPRPQITFQLKKADLSVEVSVFFCTSNASFRILKNAWEVFSKQYYFHNSLKIILFQKIFPPAFCNILTDRCFRVPHIEMVEIKWLWGVVQLRILMNYGA